MNETGITSAFGKADTSHFSDLEPNRTFTVDQLLLITGAFLCALFLLMGRWSPARLLNYQQWDTIPWYMDLRPPMVVCGLLVIASITHRGRPIVHAPAQISISVYFIVLVLLVWTLTSDIGGIDCHTPYCAQKALDIVWLACFLFVTYRLAQQPGFEDYFYGWMLLLCMVLALLGLRGALETTEVVTSGNTALESGRNIYSRLLGTLAILSLYYYVKSTRMAQRLLFLGNILLSLGLLVLTGSRGGTAASLFGLGVAALVFNVPTRWLLIISFIVGLSLATFVEFGFLQAFAHYVTKRYIDQTLENVYLSGRDTIALEAVSVWQKYPLLGAGLARFSELSQVRYPHNFFLELLAEAGLVGTSLLLLPLGVILRFILRNWPITDKRGIAICALYLVGAQVSGDLYDSRALILIPAAIACGTALRLSLAHTALSPLDRT